MRRITKRGLCVLLPVFLATISTIWLFEWGCVQPPRPDVADELDRLRADFYGDPLPTGGIARLGTNRFRWNKPPGYIDLQANSKWIVVGNLCVGLLVIDAVTGYHLTDIEQLNLASFVDRDGVTHVSGAGDLMRWTPINGSQRLPLRLNDQGRVSAAEFSQDGQQLCTWTSQLDQADGKIRLWDVRNHRLLREILAPTCPQRLVFSPDNRYLAEISRQRVRIVCVADGTAREILSSAQDDFFVRAAFSPDSDSLWTANFWESRIRIWDVEKGIESRSISVGTHGTKVITFSREGNLAAYGGDEGVLYVRSVPTDELITKIPTALPIHGIGFSSGGNTIIAALSLKRRIELATWELSTGLRISTFSRHDDLIYRISFATNGEKMVTTSRDGTVRMWDATTGKHLFRFGETFPKDYPPLIAMAPDEKTLAIAQGSSIHCYDTDSGQLIHKLQSSPGFSTAIDFSPTGDRIATLLCNPAPADSGSEPKFHDSVTLKVYEWGSGNAVLTLSDLRASRLAFSPDGKLLVTSRLGWERYGGSRLSIWDARTGSKLREFPGLQFAISPDSINVAVIDEGIVREIDLMTGNPVRDYGAVNNGLNSCGNYETVNIQNIKLAFSKDGTQLAVGGTPARVYRTGTGELAWEGIAELDQQTVAFAPDGKRLATGGEDAMVMIWDITSKQGPQSLTATNELSR